ncbi:MAG TPA: YwiC-like family protein [Aggregatilineaceae bacterium]|nr:YwiC-like family protein [Anaerolineae bacterium]HMM29433.1 YwiC-like family protein [Aggregatilineaceae bacterium]
MTHDPMDITLGTPSQVRWKAVALPPEHGGWGFLLEPIALGLLVAPSWAGFFLGVAALGAFLMQHPLKLAYTDRRRGRRYARTAAAERVLVVYAALAMAGFVVAVALGGLTPLLPLALASPLALVQVVNLLRNRGRELPRELAGAATLAGVAAAIALAGGAERTTALGLWAVLAARDIPSIVYVRERLRLEKGKPAARGAVIVAHVVALAAIALLAWAGVTPWLATLAIAILLARAAYGVSPWRRAARPQTIGFLELGLGLLTVVLTALGVALGV